MIKPVKKCTPQQRVAYTMFYFADPAPANLAICNEVIVQGKSLTARKSLPEPPTLSTMP